MGRPSLKQEVDGARGVVDSFNDHFTSSIDSRGLLTMEKDILTAYTVWLSNRGLLSGSAPEDADRPSGSRTAPLGK